jgi:hypothetical protein
VYLAALLLFLSVLVKKYALTVVIGVASTLIPYIGLSRQICYRLPAGNRLFGGDFLRGGFADRRSHRDFFRTFPPGIAGPAWPVLRFLHPHDMVGAAAKHKLLAV